MEFVRHNRRNITLRAAFIVAFFASFFVFGQEDSDPFTDGTILTESPATSSAEVGDCNVPSGYVLSVKISICKVLIESYISNFMTQNGFYSLTTTSALFYEDSTSRLWSFSTDYLTTAFKGTPEEGRIRTKNWPNLGIGAIRLIPQASCPPDKPDFFHYTYPVISGDGETISACANPADVNNYYNVEADANKADKNCSNLILDSGNNNNSVMCYTSPTGNSCNVEMVQGAGYDYYVGTGSNPLGCANSEHPPFDSSGIGDDSDNCITSNGTDFCSAEKSKHCTSSNGVETCDSGCIEINGNFMCDPSKHPDVGEGDSDYFDSKGTCSVVAGSAYKGACEELGGTWEKEGDYTETSCPPTSISGTCSVGTNGGCFACLDAGGTWEPDPNTPLNNTEKGIQDVAALTQKTNDALKVLELTGRKGTESLISTIKTGNQTLIGEIKTLTGTGSGGVGGLGQKLDEIKDELEKETFTTTTGNIDKSLINGLFDSQKIAAVKANQEVIKTEIQTFINTSRAELSNILKINSPASTGYQARTVTLYDHTIDLSLNRFSDFFSMLAAPILFVCSIFALFIMLGRD